MARIMGRCNAPRYLSVCVCPFHFARVAESLWHPVAAIHVCVPFFVGCTQWTPQPSSSSVNVLYPGYSFTADFRPPNQNATQQPNSPMLETTKLSPPSPQRPFYTNNNMTYSPPRSPQPYAVGQTKLRSGKVSSLGVNYEDEDSNDCIQSESKPNLCRLCGKTYARPSTLKTHLRTHSGERPYRYVLWLLSTIGSIDRALTVFIGFACPSRCPDCNKSFSQAANLTAHVRTHVSYRL